MLCVPIASVKPFGARLLSGTMARSVRWICTLISCVLLTTCTPALGNMDDLCKVGRTKPVGDIKLEYGKVPLVITCNIFNPNKIAAFPNISSYMYYTKAGGVELLPSMTRIINSTSIQLMDEHPLQSNSLYTCKLRDPSKEQDESICWNDVSIGVKPYKVDDFKCVSINYENLTCSWTPVNTVVDTIYGLSFHYGSKFKPNNNCPKIEYPQDYDSKSKKIRCVLDLNTEPQYRMVQPVFYFTLHMRNEFGNYSNPTYEFQHFKNVRSGPPERLEAINSTTSSIYLNWSIPDAMVTFPRPLQYRVLYQCEYGPKIWLPGDGNNGTITEVRHDTAQYYYNLTGLAHAHALCDIRVAIRSADAHDDDMWSTNASITAPTSSGLPGAPPQTTIGSFEISFSEIETVTDITRNEVYIYWQQIGDDIKNGEDFRYETMHLRNGSYEEPKFLERTNAYAKYGNLVLSNTYKFAVYTINSQGRSVGSSEIVVPAQILRPKEPGSFTKVSFGKGLYELRWEPAAHDEGANRPALTGYTLFWCSNDRDRPYQCTGHLDWLLLPADVTSHRITVVENKQVTQFAIAANSNSYSSGMLWASCTILHDKYVGKIRDFWINNVGSTHIEVGWKLACSERIGNVVGYTIHYCPIISPKETECKGELQTQSIPGDANLIHGRIKHLIPYTTYMLRISVVTATIGIPANKTSQISDALYNTTLEAAPTPPLRLTVLNVTNSSIALTWDVPQFSNGVLKYYSVTYNDDKSNSSVIVETGSEKNKKTYVLKSLQSFFKYSITVRACTTLCSEPSEMVEVTTEMGSPGIISSINQRFQNDSYVLVSWPEPNPPRGNCDYYQLKIKQEIDYKNDTLPINNATEHQYAVTQCGDNNRYNTFYMSVRAVNIIEDRAFPGPWSDEIKFFCKTPPGSIFWVVFSTGMAILAVLFVWLGRRCYHHYRDMRNVEVKLPPGLVPSTNMGDGNVPYWTDNTGKNNTLMSFGLNLPGVVSGNNHGDSANHYPHTLYNGKEKDSHHHHHHQQSHKSDEEVVLLKMNSNESDQSSNGGDSSGCSTGHESAGSSLGGGAVDGREDDIDVDIDIGAVGRRNTDRCSSDSGTDQANSNSTNSLIKTNSLRLRKSTPGTTPSATAVSNGYVAVPPDLSGGVQTVGQSAPLWSVGPNSTSVPNNSYCMLGIDPTASNTSSTPVDFVSNPVQAVARVASASPYITFDSQQQPPTINRGIASPVQQQAAPITIPRPVPPSSLQQGIKSAVSGTGYIPLMYGDPSDTENDLATTPPATQHNLMTQPPNYVVASTKQQEVAPKIAVLTKRPHQQDFIPSLITVNTVNIPNDKVLPTVYLNKNLTEQQQQQQQQPLPYVQAAPMPQNKLHLQSIVIDGSAAAAVGVTSPGYVTVADVMPVTATRQDRKPPQHSSPVGYIPHRPLTKNE